MSDWIEQDGKKYFEEGYFAGYREKVDALTRENRTLKNTGVNLLEENEKLTAQNARLRAELEDLANHFEEMSRSTTGDAITWSCAATTCRESLEEIAAETPAQSLEAVRAEAGRERAMLELEALSTLFEEISLAYSRSAAASAFGLCRVKIGRRLEEIAKEGV